MAGRYGARHQSPLSDRQRRVILDLSISREAAAERTGYSVAFVDRLRREHRRGVSA